MTIEDVSVEGSAARAADRGADQFGDDILGGVTPLLSNAAVMLGLVREFASSVIDVRKKYHTDELTAADSFKQVHQLAVEYSDIIMGRDKRYQSSDFYSIEQLGDLINKRVPADESVSDPGELFFLAVASALLMCAIDLEQGLRPDNEVADTIATIISECTEFLLWGRAVNGQSS